VTFRGGTAERRGNHPSVRECAGMCLEGCRLRTMTTAR
jgi:hypothetical protein